ncbi:MAG: SGNH/GDSL hydrolase family protein [Actinomycetota bacterium]
MPAGEVVLVSLVALMIGLVLNAPDILETANRQEEGWQRRFGVAATKPFAWFSHTIFFDRPHNLIDTALGRSSGESPSVPSTTTTMVAAPSTTTTVPARRAITPSQPLRLFIGGDSMVGQFGPMLENVAEENGQVEVTEVLYEFSSGITRRDFVDWPARLRQISIAQDPEVLVLFLGGNDAQAIQVDGAWHNFGTPEWTAEYHKRVGDLMAELAADGREVYWVGLPIVRSEEFREKVAVMNEIYRSEADRFEEVTFIDSWPLFTGPDGGYSEYLTDERGNLIDMRLNDGIHLTTAGAIRLAGVVYEAIATAWNIG